MFNQYFKNLTDINRYLTDTENQFIYKVSVMSVKYRLNIVLDRLYRFKYRFTQISILAIFYRCLTDTN